MTGLRASLTLRRPGFTLDLTLTASPGEVIAVLGPNGAGKSTLLAALAGLVRPDDGTVLVGERVLTDLAIGRHLPPHRRGVALLAQQPLLFPHLTALANVAFGPRAAGRDRAAATAVARRWLAEVDLTEYADRKPSALSGGQAQRVALARALAADPVLLLLDEPFAALDVDAAPALRGLVRRVLRASGRTAVLVTHDPLDALALADRVVVLDAGSIAEQGPTRAVLAAPRTPFAARIAGLNLIPGVACAGGLLAEDGTVVAGAMPEQTTGEPSVAVFRPADVAVYPEPVRGSPRNVFPAVIAALEPHGDLVRLRAAPAPGGPAWITGLAADLTIASVADLDLAPGHTVYLAVKATEVAVHPVARG